MLFCQVFCRTWGA